MVYRVKVNVATVLVWGCRRELPRPSIGREVVGGNTTVVCGAWIVRRQTYGYLTSLRWYQITLQVRDAHEIISILITAGMS